MAIAQYAGKTTPLASVTVRFAGTSVAATIYASEALAAKSNPITANAQGEYGFWVEEGLYDIINGATSGDLEDVAILTYRDVRIPSSEVSIIPYRSNAIKTLQGWYQHLTDWLWSGGTVYPKTSGSGIKVDTDSPTFGWHDIIGAVSPKTSGAGTPTFATYAGNIQAFKFVANDIVDCVFHIPHDLVPGSDIFLHVHWSHTGTAISGNAVFTHYSTYAKGHNQANFPAEVTDTITYNTTNIATTPRYRHRVDEIQLSTAGGSASKLDTSALEVDGLILVRIKLTTLPTITAGDLFIHTIDIHYQSTGIPTKGKAPDFWT